MDKIERYRQFIEQLLIEYSKNDPLEEGVKTQLVFDRERHHYHWMNVGWDDLRHVHYSIVHFDIKDGKIWIQKNLTEANSLLNGSAFLVRTISRLRRTFSRICESAPL